MKMYLYENFQSVVKSESCPVYRLIHFLPGAPCFSLGGRFALSECSLVLITFAAA